MSRISLKRHSGNKNYPILILGIVCSFYYLIADFSINVILLVILLTALEACVCVWNISKRPLLRFSTLHGVIILMAITIFFNVRNEQYLGEQPFYLYSLLMLILVLFFVSPGIESRKKVLHILLLSSAVVSFIVVVSSFLPSIYEVILSLISETSREYSKWIMSIGYSGAVGKEIGRTAHYVVVGLPILMGRYYGRKEKRYLLLCAVWLMFLALVGRRSELLAAFLSIMVMIYLTINWNGKRLYILFAGLLLLSFISAYFLIVTGIVSYHGNNRIINSVFLAIKGNDVTNGRSRLYLIALDLFKQHPLFGIGWGGYRQYSREVLSDVTNVHNMYLQSLCEVGIVGTIVFLLSVIYLIRYIYKAYKKHLKDSYLEVVMFSMFMAIYLLLIGLLDNTVYHDDFWLLESIILFCVYRLETKEEIKEKCETNASQSYLPVGPVKE